jgi:hypothetical protein
MGWVNLVHGPEAEAAAFATNFDAAGKVKGFAAAGLLSETKHGVNVDGTELAGAGFHFFDEEANHALAHGFGGVPGPQLVKVFGFVGLRTGTDEISQGNAPCAFVFLGVEEETQFRGTFQPRVVFAGQIGKPAEMLNNRRLKLFLEERHELQTNAGTGACGVAVGGIFAPGLATGTEIGAKRGAANFEKWAKDGARLGMNASEPGEARSAENVSKDGFGLIVGGVGHGDFVKLAIGDESFEKGVARAAGGVFEVGALAFGFRCDIFTRNEEGQVVAGGEFGDELFIGVGSFAAQLVIEVHHRKDDAELFAKFEKKKEEGHGIGASGNGRANAGAGAEQVFSNVRGEKTRSQTRNLAARRFGRRRFLGHDGVSLS